MWDKIIAFIKQSFSWLILPGRIGFNNVLEIIILAFVIYAVIRWIKNTRAWALFKGILVIVLFAIFAYVFQLTTILWILTRTYSVIIISVFIVFQPELRRALEQLGRRNIVSSIFGSGDTEERYAGSREKCQNEVVKAVFEMSKVKTGALIVMEKDVLLSEYERTGISLDAIVTSQLLMNIFEHNTPLHDGAVFIRDTRIIAATCYLPLSDNVELSKELGTRHRAAVGISEVSDSITIVVSEETGGVSVAKDGQLYRDLDVEGLKEKLSVLKKRSTQEKKLRKLKGIIKNEKKADK